MESLETHVRVCQSHGKSIVCLTESSRPCGHNTSHSSSCTLILYDFLGLPGRLPAQVHNENGTKRVVVTKDLPGTRWIDILTAANIRVEVCAHEDIILSQNTIKTLISDGCRQCHGVIGQLTEVSYPFLLYLAMVGRVI